MTTNSSESVNSGLNKHCPPIRSENGLQMKILRHARKHFKNKRQKITTERYDNLIIQIDITAIVYIFLLANNLFEKKTIVALTILWTGPSFLKYLPYSKYPNGYLLYFDHLCDRPTLMVHTV